MKRILSLVIVATIFLCACGVHSEPEQAITEIPVVDINVPLVTADELARIVMTAVGIEHNSMISANKSYGEEAMASYVENYYGLASECWSDCAIYHSAEGMAYEVSIFRLTEQADISSVFNCLEEYRHARQGDFFGYMPEQADMVDRGIVSIGADGMSAAVLICDYPHEADEAFYAAQGKPLPEDIYPSDEENEASFLSASELAEHILTDGGISRENLEYMECINDTLKSADETEKYIQSTYCIIPPEWTDCSIYVSKDKDYPYEISVFKLSDTAEPNIVMYNLSSYILSRAEDFTENSEMTEMLENAAVCVEGSWAGLFVCADPYKAEEMFRETVKLRGGDAEISIETGELPEYWEPYVDPEIDDMSLWDNTALVKAIKAADDSALDKDTKRLYREAVKVLEDHISDGMSPVEKERAIYEWLTANCEYDHRHYNVPNNAPRISYEPYGAIVEGKAVCLGYATAFQLFMDVLDIECITVVGGAFQSREDHAWNMVCLDGEWFCVDPTWDANVSPEYFNYFNVSSDYMAMTGHQWDYEGYPMAYHDNDGNWAEDIWVIVD